jgi:hypothetical protein
MGTGLLDVNQFWSYVRDTKNTSTRSIVFHASAQGVKVLTTFKRGSTSHEDIENLSHYLSQSYEPVWFLVRCDFDDPSDSRFKLGFAGLPTASTNRFVRLLGSHSVGFVPCAYYGSKLDIEERLWDHLCPLVDDPPNSFSSMIASALIEHDGQLKLLPSINVSDFCRSRRVAFVLQCTDTTVHINLFKPVGVCPRCRIPVDNAPHDGLLSRKRQEIIPWLQAFLFDSLDFSFGCEINACVDLACNPTSAPVVTKDSTGRRRSNHIILSPPTLDKYTGPSKRTRNFPDRLIAN